MSKQFTLNALNATIWPAPGGIFTVDQEALSVAVEQAASVGVIALAPAVGDLVDLRVLDLVLSHLPSTIDLEGASWTPLEVQLPLE
jgi:hypothetical protein